MFSLDHLLHATNTIVVVVVIVCPDPDFHLIPSFPFLDRNTGLLYAFNHNPIETGSSVTTTISMTPRRFHAVAQFVLAGIFFVVLMLVLRFGSNLCIDLCFARSLRAAYRVLLDYRDSYFPCCKRQDNDVVDGGDNNGGNNNNNDDDDGNENANTATRVTSVDELFVGLTLRQRQAVLDMVVPIKVCRYMCVRICVCVERERERERERKKESKMLSNTIHGQMMVPTHECDSFSIMDTAILGWDFM